MLAALPQELPELDDHLRRQGQLGQLQSDQLPVGSTGAGGQESAAHGLGRNTALLQPVRRW